MIFVFMVQAIESFNKIKQKFTMASMLIYYNPLWKIMLECDASGYAVSGIIFQLISSSGQWHSITFWLQKMNPVERNYGIGKSEMLAIVKCCKEWRYYLKGATYFIRVVTNHCNLKMFLTTKTLNKQEARW